MSGYTISKLAEQAGVSVHVVRDYLLRGLLHPVRRTDSGYGIFDAQSLARLRFVRTAFEAGIDLRELARWCQALDGGGGDIDECRAHLRSLIAARREALVVLDRQLAAGASPRRTGEPPCVAQPVRPQRTAGGLMHGVCWPRSPALVICRCWSLYWLVRPPAPSSAPIGASSQ